MRIPTCLAALCVALAPHAVTAQQVSHCDDGPVSAANIVEPWETHSRTFAGGDVRVALMDTVEPAAGAMHLLVLTPPYDILGGRTCRLVSMDGTMGFSGIEFTRMTASYDPSRGLTLTLPVTAWLSGPDDFAPATLSVTINQASGRIDAALR